MGGGLLRRIPPARLYLGATVLIGLLAAVVTVAQMAFLSEIVDLVFLKGGGRERVLTLLSLLAGTAVLRAGLLWVRETTAQQGAVRVKSDLRERLFAHVLRLGPAYARSERTGELTTTLTEGVERLDPYFARYLPQVLLSAVVPLLVVAYILPRDAASAVLLVVTAPVIPVMMVLVGSYAEEHTRRQWLALSRMAAHFLDALQGLPTLKAFGRVAAEEEKVERVSGEFRERTLKVLRYAFLSGLVLEFMTAAAIALVAVVLGVRLINGAISFQDAFLVLLLTPEFYRPLRELGVHRHAGMEGKASAERIFEILDTPVPPDGTLQENLSGGLELSFSDVRFTYPGRDIPALDGLSLTLPVGSRTALVGRSGSGKSTLVGLLLRFLNPDAGVISANGVPIGDLPARAWREHVALVPQRPHLFYGSVLENIRLAKENATRSEIERAAELAGAAEFIRRMPHGYDTQIGERGQRLSGGEAQRLRDALDRLARGRTSLIVAHRLNTVRTADRIVVLHEGQVAETGTHVELLERKGHYSLLAGAYEDVPA
jgi:ATP-binding cassette, subfamily C, bacterial CydD